MKTNNTQLMTGKQLVTEYNELAQAINVDVVKKFRDLPTARRRVESMRKQHAKVAPRIPNNDKLAAEAKVRKAEKKAAKVNKPVQKPSVPPMEGDPSLPPLKSKACKPKGRSGPKIKLTYAPDIHGHCRPREGTLSCMILDVCEREGGASIADLEEVVVEFQKEKGNYGKTKCSVRYFACKAVSNLRRYNGYGFRREGLQGAQNVFAYTYNKK